METYTSGPLNHYRRPKFNNELATRIVGGHCVLASIIGICFNVFMFFHFLSLEKLSFYILCTSKTVSNTLSLLVYLTYIGPANLFYTSIGSMTFNARLQQIFGFGLFLQGPMTELLVTVNRFVIIIFSPTKIPTYSAKITVFALAATWCFAIWLSWLPGFPDYCFVQFAFDHVGYYESDCSQEVVLWLIFIIFPLALFNNAMNFILGAKLIVLAKRQRHMTSSEAAKRRRNQTIKFFIQSVIQDWMTALVAGSNMLLTTFYCKLHTCIILTTFTIDSLVYCFDGSP
uniref:7TM_GPCR_Srx domain-containing protein n=1 Tax=Caenorhabditis tropicalis TaxID=1561998 RepID=A0A1I7V3D1_9PELO